MEKSVFKKRREKNKILSFPVNVVFHRKLQRAEESRSASADFQRLFNPSEAAIAASIGG